MTQLRNWNNVHFERRLSGVTTSCLSCHLLNLYFTVRNLSWPASSITQSELVAREGIWEREETSKAGQAGPASLAEWHIVFSQQWRAITVEPVISRGLPVTVPASLWAIGADCFQGRGQTKHIRGMRRHTWGLSDGKWKRLQYRRECILPARHTLRCCFYARAYVKCVVPGHLQTWFYVVKDELHQQGLI